MKDGCLAEIPSTLTFTVLASGSKGNCLHIADGETAILVDAGCSCREILRRMQGLGLPPDGLSAIVLSHEHTDHVTGAGVLSRKLALPVYGTSATLDAAAGRTGAPHQRKDITCGVPFAIGSLLLHPFSIPHDATDPVGFTFSSGNVKIGIATDLGVATTLVKSHLKGCHALILEANHCPEMLDKGPYPWPLKQRVKGRMGHLSNESSRDLLGDLLHKDLSHVVIAHLSEQNNRPERAACVVGEALNGSSVHLQVARQDSPLAPVHVTRHTSGILF